MAALRRRVITDRKAGLSTGSTRLVSYRDPGGWRLMYPSTMYRERLRYTPPGAGEGWMQVRFANFVLPRDTSVLTLAERSDII